MYIVYCVRVRNSLYLSLFFIYHPLTTRQLSFSLLLIGKRFYQYNQKPITDETNTNLTTELDICPWVKMKWYFEKKIAQGNLLITSEIHRYYSEKSATSCIYTGVFENCPNQLFFICEFCNSDSVKCIGFTVSYRVNKYKLWNLEPSSLFNAWLFVCCYVYDHSFSHVMSW